MAAGNGKPSLWNPRNRPPELKAPLLNSWKEIAAYLRCGVRTAQRWERDLSLPVYRPRPGQRGPVCAFPGELKLWLRHQRVEDALLRQVGNPVIQASRELTRQSTALVHKAAANTRLQQEYAARLLDTIETLKTRIERRLRFGRAG